MKGDWFHDIRKKIHPGLKWNISQKKLWSITHSGVRKMFAFRNSLIWAMDRCANYDSMKKIFLNLIIRGDPYKKKTKNFLLFILS
jgi:hypothetical protein